MPSYGTNLKRVRGDRRQENLAKAAGKARQANLPTYEHNRRFPTPELVRQHAKMLGASTSDLMLGVVTDYDRVRWPDLSETEREVLLAGLTLMPHAQRQAIVRACASEVAAFLELPTHAATAPGLESKPETGVIAKHIRRGKKSA